LDGGKFDGYLALPASGFGPGIVVLPRDLRRQRVHAERGRLVRGGAGLLLFVPIFLATGTRYTANRSDRGRTAEKRLRYIKVWTKQKAVDDSAAAVEFLRQHPACNGKVGAVGFCLGGNLAWLLSVRYQPDCAVGYYGVSIEKTLDEAGNLTSPLLLHIAGRDQHCPPEAQARIHARLDSNPHATIHDYAEQDHAFGRPGGEHYDAPAAELAHLRTLEFFTRNLAGSGQTTAQKACLIFGTSTSNMNSPRVIRKIL